jgi:two-component sensor histidine kinase
MAETSVRTPEVAAEYALALEPLPVAAKIARLMVTDALRAWELPELTANASLIITELVTNAIRYGHKIVVRLARPGGDTAAVLVEVWDDCDDLPSPDRPPDENGFGLVIVEELADDWGYRVAADGGKVAWAILHRLQR